MMTMIIIFVYALEDRLINYLKCAVVSYYPYFFRKAFIMPFLFLYGSWNIFHFNAIWIISAKALVALSLLLVRR